METTDKVNVLVGENLRRLREARGFTRVDLAGRAGFDDSYLGKMERGLRGTSSGGYQRLADALGVGVQALFAPSTGGRDSVAPVSGKRKPRRSRRRRHARSVAQPAGRA